LLTSIYSVNLHLEKEIDKFFAYLSNVANDKIMLLKSNTIVLLSAIC